jgi:DNA polymerase elongation subunit (family B)
MSYKKFLEFFQKAENPIYSKNDDPGSKKRSKQYLIVTPQEQYMIASGKRFFKGYEDYNELLRLIFDLETEGLDPTRHRITDVGIRFNRPINTKTGYREYSQTFSLKGETEEEKDAYEIEMIKVMLKMIQHYKPDIITAHNGENFDWWFIFERCKVLGVSL